MHQINITVYAQMMMIMITMKWSLTAHPHKDVIVMNAIGTSARAINLHLLSFCFCLLLSNNPRGVGVKTKITKTNSEISIFVTLKIIVSIFMKFWSGGTEQNKFSIVLSF